MVTFESRITWSIVILPRKFSLQFVFKTCMYILSGIDEHELYKKNNIHTAVTGLMSTKPAHANST